MMWIAKMNDGSIRKEFDSGKEISFATLDKNEIEEFKISESGSEVIVPFSSDSGILRLPNLHLDKISSLTNGTELKLLYDEEQQVFRLDEASLKLYNELMATDERVFSYISFTSSVRKNITTTVLFVSKFNPLFSGLPCSSSLSPSMVTSNNRFILSAGLELFEFTCN